MLRKTASSTAIIIALVLGAGIWGYTFRNAVERIGPGSKGLRSSVEMASLLHKLATRFEYGKSANSFLEYVRDSLEDFEFRKLHGSQFLTDRSNGYRTVSLKGRNLPAKYRVDLTRQSYSRVPLKSLGDFGSEFGLRENEEAVIDDRTYTAYSKFKVMLRHFSHLTAGELVTGVQRVIDPANIKTLPNKRTKRFRDLKGDSRKVSDQYAREFPNVAKLVDRYARLRKLLTVKEHKGIRYTHVRMVVTTRMNAIKKDFRHLHDYLLKLEGILVSKVTVLNKNQNRLATIYIDTRNGSTVINVMTQNGRVVPFTSKNKPVFSEAFYFPDIRELTYTLDIDNMFSLYGMRLKMWNVLVKAKYTNRDRVGKLNFHLARIPKPIVEGRFGHVMPPWLIDIGIPGNIDGYVHKFTKTLTKGNDGRGSRLSLQWDTRDGQRVTLTGKAATEFVDNRFVKFGAKILTRRVLPNSRAAKQIEQVVEAGTGALLKDVKKLSKG